MLIVTGTICLLFTMRYLPLLVVLLITAPGLAEENPLDSFTHDWRDHPIWHDGQAEIADYDAVKIIYGQPRLYVARFMTNKEHASPETFTKSATGTGREVFKFHVREDVPTEKYTYHFSTMTYIGVSDLKSLKLDMGSQEDCGATMKRVVNHDGELTWTQYAYFPNMGERTGSYKPPNDLVFFNDLPVVLRGYPFEQPRDITLPVLPNQTTTKWTPMRPDMYRVSYVTSETIKVEAGEFDTHLLRLTFVGPTREIRPPIDIWFAADADKQNVMVKYSDGEGQSYALKKLKRDAYWIR